VKADDPRRFPQWTDAQLDGEIRQLDAKIVAQQKAKQRSKLPQMQSDLHAMRLEAKRRKIAALKARHNG
jgi:hypothetical protein